MERNIGLDYLKLIMAFMVVGLHAGFLNDISPFWSYLFTQGLFRIAVPIFIMINGYFFYNTLSKNFLTWIKRLIILYFIWMVFYAYSWVQLSIKSNLLLTLLTMTKTIFIGYHHLWYLPCILGSGLMLYALKGLSEKKLLLIGALLYLTGTALQYLGNYHILTNPLFNKLLNTPFIYRNFLFFGFPLFLTGYLIAKNKINTKINRSTLIAVSMIGITLLIFENLANFYFGNPPASMDLLLSLLIICPAIFILALNSQLKSNSKNIANLATGIYLVHTFFFLIIEKYFGMGQTLITLLTIPLSIIASFGLIMLNKKVKVIL
jgi:surface polysaccharide O-acyltransferase-like enzyme